MHIAHANNFILAYLLAFIVLFVVGGIFQMSHIDEGDDDNDDDFKGEDEGGSFC